MPKKPTQAQIVNRIYRKSLDHDSELRLVNEELYSIRLMQQEITGYQKLFSDQLDRLISNQSRLISHCDSFAKRLSPLDQVNRFMSRPLK